MNAATAKAGGLALLASPVDDALIAAVLGHAVAPELTTLLAAAGLAVAAGWWVGR